MWMCCLNSQQTAQRKEQGPLLTTKFDASGFSSDVPTASVSAFFRAQADMIPFEDSRAVARPHQKRCKNEPSTVYRLGFCSASCAASLKNTSFGQSCLAHPHSTSSGK